MLKWFRFELTEASRIRKGTNSTQRTKALTYSTCRASRRSLCSLEDESTSSDFSWVAFFSLGLVLVTVSSHLWRAFPSCCSLNQQKARKKSPLPFFSSSFLRIKISFFSNQKGRNYYSSYCSLRTDDTSGWGCDSNRPFASGPSWWAHWEVVWVLQVFSTHFSWHDVRSDSQLWLVGLL